jgi:hypothetical protein
MKGRKRRFLQSDRVQRAIEASWKGRPTLPGDRPYDRVRDLIGKLSGGPPDLAERHREYLRTLIRDRR